MRVAFYEANGSARDVLRLGEIETPGPRAGEVRVRLRTSGVNPSDVKSRAFRAPAFARIVPHSDGAGEIDAVGPGVPISRLGERVWIWNGQWQRPFGTAAEFIVLPSALAVRLPEKASFEAGATLGIPALTAYRAVELAAPEKGSIVLIQGGAGAVAQFAIQFAKARGATVVTTVSSPDKAEAALEVGADHCINYQREDVAERIAALTDRRGVDSIVEVNLSANARLIPSVLRPKGKVVVYGSGAEAVLPSTFCLLNSVQLLFFLVYTLDAGERERAVSAVNEALAAGRLDCRIGPTFALEDIAAAHEAVEKGAIGNVIVLMG